MLIPKGTIYNPTKWMLKEGTIVDEPNSVDLVSFASDEKFGKWTCQQNFRGFFELLVDVMSKL